MSSGESFADGGPGRCLEPEEMLALASGERPAGPAGHVIGCGRCRRAVEDVAATVRGRAARHRWWAPPRLQSCAPVSIALTMGMVLGFATVARRQPADQAAPAPAAEASVLDLQSIYPAPASGWPPTDIAAVIREKTASIQHCYDRGFHLGDIGRPHRLDLELRILGNGRVNQIRTTEYAPEAMPDVARCVRRAALRWTFRPSGGVYEVAFPLIFGEEAEE